MSKNPLNRISSSRQLYVLALTSGKAEIYFVKRSGATLVVLPTGLPTPMDAARLSAQTPSVPWAILVDQSEESFWGGTMPPLKGAAQEAWINRMADQSGSDSPYRWWQMQGKSTSQEGQLRVLGYTLGRAEALTPWLDALKGSQARLRGVYAPAMLLPSALKTLRLTPSKNPDDITVLVTPHPDGLRQVVMVGGLVRFSRLALHSQADGDAWFGVVTAETAKLREYLLGNGLLKNDRAGMQIDCVLPPSAIGLAVPGLATPALTHTHSKDRYNWLSDPLPFQVYVTALAANQPWRQLAPRIYRKRDLSVHGARTLYAICAVVLAAGILYVGWYGAQLWDKQQQTTKARLEANQADQRYLEIAKTFAKTPLTSAQLIEMRQRWEGFSASTPPAMQVALAAAGQTLERHPLMLVEELTWIADMNQSGDSALDALEATALAGAATAPAASPTPSAVTKEKKPVTTLVLRGSIRGVASDDLRGTRDALTKLEDDFNRHPHLRAEITKRPLDLSAKSALTGSGAQDKAELSFEIKLWQR